MCFMKCYNYKMFDASFGTCGVKYPVILIMLSAQLRIWDW